MSPMRVCCPTAPEPRGQPHGSGTKRVIATLVGLLLLTAAAPPPASAAGWPDLSLPAAGKGGGENDAALVVGIESYAALQAVPGAVRNAKDWANYFAQTRNLPFGSYKVLLNDQATLDDIKQAAEDVAAKVKPGGTLWFVFIGHGAPAKNGDDGLLIGWDAKQTAASLYVRSLPQKSLAEILGKGTQARTVMVVDACFSGKRPDGGPLVAGLQPILLAQMAPALGNAVLLLAAGTDQFAGPLPGQARPAFSYLVLGGLRGWADENADGIVTGAEVAKFTQSVLWSLVKDRIQTPEVVGDGSLALATGAREARPDLSAIALAIAQPAGPEATPSPTVHQAGGGNASTVGEVALDFSPKPSSEGPAAVTESSSRWWLWTGVGAVVVGGIVTAVALSTRSSGRDGTCSPGLNGCVVVGN